MVRASGMMAALLALAVLAGCGADGEPVRPTYGATVSVGSDGVRTGASVGLRKGPLSVGLGL
ncbi:hypothetical protein [Litorisediminicola beolgyonensis]|uniref:Argininosuccinate lyase n=1 Tax=Litorisediminicola beolgyonensis TaxID=1173614 RepID=A0ABW3ZKX9_9RHOB